MTGTFLFLKKEKNGEAKRSRKSLMAEERSRKYQVNLENKRQMFIIHRSLNLSQMVGGNETYAEMHLFSLNSINLEFYFNILQLQRNAREALLKKEDTRVADVFRKIFHFRKNDIFITLLNTSKSAPCQICHAKKKKESKLGSSKI